MGVLVLYFKIVSCFYLVSYSKNRSKKSLSEGLKLFLNKIP